jgi:hypothetical protein
MPKQEGDPDVSRRRDAAAKAQQQAVLYAAVEDGLLVIRRFPSLTAVGEFLKATGGIDGRLI